MKLYTFGLLALVLAACTEPAPQDSSSSHWLQCDRDRQCLSVSQGVACSADRFCVDAQGERVEVATGNAELGSSNAGREDPECDPLALVQQPTALGQFVALARGVDGTTYLIDRQESNLRVFIADGSVLIPQDVSGTGEGSGEISLLLGAGDGAYSLYLAPENAPNNVRLIAGSQEKSPSPGDGEPLEVLPRSALDAFTFGPLVSGVRIEHHAQAETGEHVVVVVPERNFAYESFRLFYGKGNALVERRVVKVVRSKGGGTSIDFSLDGEGVNIEFQGTLSADEETGDVAFVEGTAILTQAGGELELSPSSKNEAALNAITASCFSAPPNGWSYTSNDALPPDVTPNPTTDIDAGSPPIRVAPDGSIDSGTNRESTDDVASLPDDGVEQTDTQTQAERDDGSTAQACQEQLPLNACLETASPLSDDGGIWRVSGVVTELGRGYPARGVCATNPSPDQQGDAGLTGTTRYGFGMPVTGLNADDAVWLVIRDENERDTLLSLTARGFDAEPLLGANLQLEMHVASLAFAPLVGHVSLTTNDGGSVFWMGEAGSPAELSGPVPLSLGVAECEQSSACVSSWFQHSIAIYGSDAGIGPDVVVPYGTQVQTPNWMLSNGAVQVQSPQATTCPDGYVALARAAIWPAP